MPRTPSIPRAEPEQDRPAAAPAYSASEYRSRLEAILDLSDDAIISISTDGIITGWNQAAERIYQYRPDEIIGKPLTVLVPLDRLPELSGLYRSIERGKTVERYETVRLRRDGVPIDVALSLAPIHDGGHVVGALAVARDVTETQRAIREAEQSSVMLSERERMLQRALVALRKSHEQAKSTQLQLVQAAKLESIGRLAAGVAHEVKNPLAVILFAVDYLMEVIPAQDENVSHALRDAREAVLRADTVIRGLLDFSTSTELTPDVVNVNDLVRRALQLIRHALVKAHVLAVEDLHDDLPPAMLDRNKVEQVFVNLMINAIDAMPSGGTLIVRTRKEQLTEVGAEVGLRKTDRFQVGQSVIYVEIEDTGTGIDENSKPRLFDPFFTTKPPGKGTGLGLAVCKSIVALHGGTIRIANKEGGGGARATVVLQSVRTRTEGQVDGQGEERSHG